MSTRIGRTVAVVIGAGIAGLAATRVLADRYEQVVLLDRDDLPDSATPRRGVPQGHHGHVLLVAGQRALEELFPGLSDELVAAGAVPFDSGLGLRFHRFGSLWPAVPSGLRLISLSRPLLELALRRRVAALPNVTVRPGAAVSGLLPAGPDWTAGPTGPVGPRIGGVVLERGEPLAADLVVDCSGRGGRSDRWLAALGLPVPEVVEVKVGVGYATRLVRRTASSACELEGGQAMLLLPTPPAERRVGLVLPIEGDRWLVSVGGWHGDHARDGADGFLSFARELPHPAFAAVAGGCEPLTGVATFRFPSSRRRLFERLRRPPAGYLALGDAVCSFNPIYGQGMTCAVLDARALGETLDRHPGASAAMVRDFYRAAAKVISTPWRFAVGGDFAFPETTGPRPRAVHLLNRYSRRVQLAARVSPEVRRAFTGVQQLVLPPSALFAPPVLARVLRGAIAK